MTSRIRLGDADLPSGVPAHVRDALLDSGLPARFTRFEIEFSAGQVMVDPSAPTRVVLATNDSGEIFIDTNDGSVWWRQRAIHHQGLAVESYDQFVNTDVALFCACAEAVDRLVAAGSWSAAALEAAIVAIDPNALDRESVWGDVIEDAAAGL